MTTFKVELFREENALVPRAKEGEGRHANIVPKMVNMRTPSPRPSRPRGRP